MLFAEENCNEFFINSQDASKISILSKNKAKSIKFLLKACFCFTDYCAFPGVPDEADV